MIDENQIEVLPIHFNVPNHYLPLDEFIETAKSVEKIIQNFNDKFFDGKLEIKILVLPPKDGTFLKKLGITCTVTVMTWGFIESDIGKAFIKGLTGHEPAHWAEQAGEKTKELVILKESTKGFLEKNSAQLHEIGINQKEFECAYQAKNNFYNLCLKDEQISGIEFKNEGEFPIQRNKFKDFIVEDRAILNEDEEDEKNNEKEIWNVEIQEIQITSPDWEGKRMWTAICDDKHIKIIIQDAHFWSKVENRELNPEIMDILKVQWAYAGKQTNRKKITVLKVLEFNGKKISKNLSGRDLKKMLDSFIKQGEETEDTQLQLL